MMFYSRRQSSAQVRLYLGKLPNYDRKTQLIFRKNGFKQEHKDVYAFSKVVNGIRPPHTHRSIDELKTNVLYLVNDAL